MNKHIHVSVRSQKKKKRKMAKQRENHFIFIIYLFYLSILVQSVKIYLNTLNTKCDWYPDHQEETLGQHKNKTKLFPFSLQN